MVEKSDNAPFLDRTPAEIVTSGDVQDVPWITSVVSEEGIWPVAGKLNRVRRAALKREYFLILLIVAVEFITQEKALKQLNDNWELLAPDFLDFNYTIPREKHAETARLIKEHYFGSKPIDRHTTKQLVQMAGDRYFVIGSEKAARMQARANQNPVWYYYYSYEGAESLSFSFHNNTEKYGKSR